MNLMMPTPETVPTLVVGPNGLLEVRRFSDAAIQAQLDKLVASLPEDHTTLAFEVGAGSQEGTVTAMLAFKTENNWTVASRFSAQLQGQWNSELGLAVRKSWK